MSNKINNENLQEYLFYIENRNLTQSTKCVYKNAIKRFYLYCENNSISVLNDKNTKIYLEGPDCLKDNKRGTTIRNYLRFHNLNFYFLKRNYNGSRPLKDVPKKWNKIEPDQRLYYPYYGERVPKTKQKIILRNGTRINNTIYFDGMGYSIKKADEHKTKGEQLKRITKKTE